MDKIKILTLLILLFFSISFVISAQEIDLKTLEGKVILSGSEPLTYAVLETDLKKYSIGGEMVEKIKNLTGFKIKVSGVVLESERPQIDAKLNVLNFNIIDPGFKYRPWIKGKIHHIGCSLFILNSEHIFYEIENIEQFDFEKDSGKDIIAAGIIEQKEQNKAKIYIESYRFY